MPIPMQRFTDRTILVTGAASGIGRAAAERLAREGAHVAVADVRSDGAGLVAESIRAAGGDAIAVVLDVRDEHAWTAAFAAAGRRHGRVDGLVNNAGVGGPIKLIVDQDLESWRETLCVNLDGAFLGVRTALRSMAAGGAVVNIASLGALIGTPKQGAYCASKAAVVSLTRTAAKEGATRAAGIRVNAICPGFVATDMAKQMVERTFAGTLTPEQMGAAIPLGAGSPEDIAGSVAFLLSDDAKWITGSIVVVDGGMAP
jgi:NAD(P)-dependent dehydrogenase (short-subunit alcohol dehydrogenase family)